MAVELRPLGVRCNIQCQYCYQNPQRDAGNVLHGYDFDRMMAAVEAEGGKFVLFGGEPLLVPLPDLERILARGFARNGSTGVQTNGTLITDADLSKIDKPLHEHAHPGMKRTEGYLGFMGHGHPVEFGSPRAGSSRQG